MQKWWQHVKQELIKPNEEQERFLLAVINRCRQEAANLSMASRNKPYLPHGYGFEFEEAKRLALLAPPGTGKSECIKWVCKFFKEYLGWTADVQYSLTREATNRHHVYWAN